MKIILYIIRTKLLNAIGKPTRFIGYLVLLAAAAFNGYIGALLLSDFFSATNSHLIFSAILFAMILVRRGTVSPFQLVKVIQNHHPYSSLHRYLINFINDSFLTIFFLFVLCFIGGFLFANDFTRLNDWFWYGYVLICSYVFRRALISSAFQNPRSHYATIGIILSWLGMFFLLGWSLTFEKNNSLIPILIIFMILMLSLGFILEEKLAATTLIRSAKIKFHRTTFALLSRNRKIRTYILIIIIMKLVFLTIVLTEYKLNPKYKLIPFMFLFSSPVITFNYLLNNSFGYMRRYWLLVDKCTSSGTSILKLFLRHLWVILAIDATISLGYILFFQTLVWPLIFSYICLIILFTPLSFYWALEFPVNVDPSLFSIKPVAGVPPALISVVLCVPFIFGYKLDFILYLFGFGYMVVASILFYKYDTYYEQNRIRVFSKLFK